MRRAVPPLLTNTRGVPDNGKRANIEAILINDWEIISITIPKANSPLKESGALPAIRRPLRVKSKNKIIRADAPMNPNSSPATAKMESPIGSGKYPNFWMLWPKPRPVKPPDPKAMSD